MIVSSAAVYFFINNGNLTKNCQLILASFCFYSAIFSFDLSHLNQYYYLLIFLSELLFIIVGLAMRVKTSILNVFLISLVYNAISYIEFSTSYSFICDNYQAVMLFLSAILIYFMLDDGLKNGLDANNHNNIINHNRSKRGLSCRSL